MDRIKRQLTSVDDLLHELEGLIRHYEHTHSEKELDCLLDRLKEAKDYLIDEMDHLKVILESRL